MQKLLTSSTPISFIRVCAIIDTYLYLYCLVSRSRHLNVR